jgi:hypothetical protein
VGHQDAFLRPRLGARYRFNKGTLAGTRGNGRDAPIAAIATKWSRPWVTPYPAFAAVVWDD